MANTTTATCLPLFPSLEMAWRDVDSSFERFCLTAGIGPLNKCCARTRSSLPARRTAAAEAAPVTAGVRRRARSASTAAKLRCIGRGYAASMVMKLRCRAWTAAQAEDWLGRWAMNLMLINVSTRNRARAGEGAHGSASSRRQACAGAATPHQPTRALS